MLRMKKGNVASHGVPVVVPQPDHKFQLDESALEELLLQDGIKDKNVVVVSVAGALRRGKSFLLDFFLRYMRARYGNEDSSDWLGNPDEPLEGFSWRGGSERDTTGILMWSEIFLAKLPNGEEVAVIFLDTQGTFDSESTVRDCATVFALSTMISSIQIYNLSQNIQEDDLQHLQLFTEYGRLALADTGIKPFQKLLFLVRDWSFPYEAEYGVVGGKKMLDKRLQTSEKQHTELRSIRNHIRSCFSEISCFLMPHPGLKVATNPRFDGRLSDIEQDFTKCLKDLVPLVLAPENLILKTISEEKVKGKDLLQYFKSYMRVYSGDELPEPKSMLVATAEANNLAAVAAAKDTYHSMMEGVCGGAKPYLNTGSLERQHARVKSQAMEEFTQKRKMGGEEFSASYKKKLESDIEEMFVQFKRHNEAKNVFKAARTPAVFFVTAVAFYTLSGVFGFLGLYYLANVSNSLMGLSFLTLVTWFWIRYSGDMIPVGNSIDAFATLIWEGFMKPCYEQCIAEGVRFAVQGSTSPSLDSTSEQKINGKQKQS